MANRRRQDSMRASGLATNSSKEIGRLRVHIPPGERKSGMPHSVEMPAPVKGTMIDASAIMLPSRSTPLWISEAITGLSDPCKGRLSSSLIYRLLQSCPSNFGGDQTRRTLDRAQR